MRFAQSFALNSLLNRNDFMWYHFSFCVFFFFLWWSNNKLAIREGNITFNFFFACFLSFFLHVCVASKYTRKLKCRRELPDRELNPAKASSKSLLKCPSLCISDSGVCDSIIFLFFIQLSNLIGSQI